MLINLHHELPGLIPRAFGPDVNCRAVGGSASTDQVNTDDDGMHLTRTAYDELPPKIAAAIASISA